MLILHNCNVKLTQEIASSLNTNYQIYSKFSCLDIDNLLSLQKQQLVSIRIKYQVDINIYPKHFNFNKASVLVSDMDSTIINIECIDELAKIAGVGDEVAKITASAMHGELDFKASLIKRLSLLSGLNYLELISVYNNSLKFNSGAKELMQFLVSNNIRSALVSGGFNFFASRVAKKLGMDDFLANELEVTNNKLTGKVLGSIIDGNKKALFVDYLVKKYNTKHNLIITLGDGSNDLLMMQKSGLSVAYNAKEILQNYADIIINYGGLDILIDFFKASKYAHY